MSEAQLLDGKRIADRIEDQVREYLDFITKRLKAQHNFSKPTIVSVRTGVSSAAEAYVKSQIKIAERVGIHHYSEEYRDTIEEEQLLHEIDRLNNSADVHGIIVQMPLPKHISVERILNRINPVKDVEGVHPENLGQLVLQKNIIAPCTAQAVMELIAATEADLYGLEVVVVGGGNVVGRPLALLLMQNLATTTVCQIGTFEKFKLEDHIRRAEILVVAVGQAGVIPGKWVKKGSIVIDVGINRIADKIVGDVNFDEAIKRAAYITPVPGGVGPLTTAILMRNVVNAFKLQKMGNTPE